MKDNEIRTLSGWTGHRFHKLNGQWKISAKQVNLLDCDQCIHNPSIDGRLTPGSAAHSRMSAK
jgi:hypothetical protein